MPVVLCGQLLACLEEDQFNRLIDSFEMVNYYPSDRIIRQGELGNAFYIMYAYATPSDATPTYAIRRHTIIRHQTPRHQTPRHQRHASDVNADSGWPRWRGAHHHIATDALLQICLYRRTLRRTLSSWQTELNRAEPG